VNDVKRTIDRGSLTWGLILIGIGAVFLFAQLDILDFETVIHRYWPMILVVIGVPMLFQRRRVWSGLWLITIGVWLQIARLKLFGLTYRTSWPLLLIALGAGIAIRALIDTAARKEHSHE
jgi:hypothetical protein